MKVRLYTYKAFRNPVVRLLVREGVAVPERITTTLSNGTTLDATPNDWVISDEAEYDSLLGDDRDGLAGRDFHVNEERIVVREVT